VQSGVKKQWNHLGSFHATGCGGRLLLSYQAAVKGPRQMTFGFHEMKGCNNSALVGLWYGIVSLHARRPVNIAVLVQTSPLDAAGRGINTEITRDQPEPSPSVTCDSMGQGRAPPHAWSHMELKGETRHCLSAIHSAPRHSACAKLIRFSTAWALSWTCCRLPLRFRALFNLEARRQH
jgi:hypothetical protein